MVSLASKQRPVNLQPISITLKNIETHPKGLYIQRCIVATLKHYLIFEMRKEPLCCSPLFPFDIHKPNIHISKVKIRKIKKSLCLKKQSKDVLFQRLPIGGCKALYHLCLYFRWIGISKIEQLVGYALRKGQILPPPL